MSKTSQLRALKAAAGLASITVGIAPAMAETPTPMPNWNDQISGIKLGANVRIIADEHGQFEGASIALTGSDVEAGSTGRFPNLVKRGKGTKLE